MTVDENYDGSTPLSIHDSYDNDIVVRFVFRLISLQLEKLDRIFFNFRKLVARKKIFSFIDDVLLSKYRELVGKI